ncbi:MAG: hypothetical protein WCS52_16805 [bacterium]
MLRAITDKRRVAEIHRDFIEAIRRALGHSAPLTIGYKGETGQMPAHYNDELWFISQLSQNSNRFWDAYGLNPDFNRSNNITVEINIPVEGVNRTISALFAEAPDTQEVFLIHRGKVGGGRPGIGKNAFTAWYNGGIATIDEKDGRTTDAYLITSLRDPHMAENVVNFVKAVSEFKASVISAGKGHRTTKIEAPGFDFHDEFSGKKSIPARASVTADCNHGRVVSALKRYLESKAQLPGQRLVNTKKIDLALVKSSQLIHVWEVKTDVSLQNLYTGIGQLIVHTMGQHKCDKTLVLPDTPNLSTPFIAGLASLGISVIYFKLGHEILLSQQPQ